MKTSEVLERALEKLGPNGEHWLQRKENDGAGNYCAMGALGDAVGGTSQDDYDFYLETRDILKAAVGTGYLRSEWNDKARDFSEIRTGFLKAIALARKQEADNAAQV